MAKSTAIRGKDLMLFIGGKAVGLATSCNISVNRATIDAKTKDDGIWSDNDAGDMSWEISADAVYATDNDSNENSFNGLFTSLIAGTEVAIKVGVTTASDSGKPSTGWVAPSTKYLSGNVILTKLDLNAAKGDNATFSMSAVGTGALTYTA